MDASIDYYRILGILPNAEIVVLRAAYRALAQKYHPDAWSGNMAEAEHRMKELNEAYGVLSNPQKREQYDRARADKTDDEFDFSDDAMRSAFYDADVDKENDWSVVAEYYPDLSDCYKRLRKISEKLAFEYRSDLLSSRDFVKRHQIADAMESAFLMRYFGSDRAIVSFAKQLIEEGNKKAAKELNRVITVLGKGTDPKTIIARIREKHPYENPVLKELARTVIRTRHASDAQKLIQLLGGAVHHEMKWFGNAPFIVSLNGKKKTFETGFEMTEWVIAEVALEYEASERQSFFEP